MYRLPTYQLLRILDDVRYSRGTFLNEASGSNLVYFWISRAFQVWLCLSIVQVRLNHLHSFHIVVDGLPVGWDTTGFLCSKDSVRLTSWLVIDNTICLVVAWYIPFVNIHMLGQGRSSDLS